MLSTIEIKQLNQVLDYFANQHSHEIANLNHIFDYGNQHGNYCFVRIFYELNKYQLLATSHNAKIYYNQHQNANMEQMVGQFEQQFPNAKLAYDFNTLSFNAIPLNYSQLRLVVHKNLKALQIQTKSQPADGYIHN